MSNYANTKATIAANVYTNHANQVTAEMVKTAINSVVDTLIAGGYLFKGVAHPGDAAVTPDANVFYLATEVGTYTNKGGLQVADGEVAVLKYNGSWSKEVTGAATAAQVAALGQKVDGIFPQVDEDGFHLVDENLNIALKYDDDGLDAAKVSDHFVEVLKLAGIAGDSPALSAFVLTNEVGFAIVDPLLNIGVNVDQDGVHAKNIVKYEII